ncbi:MAG: response regulator [Verrucomicrobiota bacterium]|nr:response regulator [Verrucomicrobiota bacterium]
MIILLIENNEGDACIIREMLLKSELSNFKLEHKTDLETSADFIANKKPDIILVNLNLSDSQGLDTLNHILKLAYDIPLVCFTVDLADNLGVEAIARGAQDFLAKTNLSPKRIKNAIMYAIERKSRENESIKYQKLNSLGFLAGGIAHDFNNLLTIIMTNVSLALSEAEFSDEITSLLNNAEDASKDAANLTRQLLTFSKGGTPERTLVPVPELLKNTVTFALSGSSLKPEYKISKNLFSAELDRGQFKQAINNVIINAIQATTKEPAKIVIAAKNIVLSDEESKEAFLPNGKYIEITIKDFGVGIPVHVLPKIFDPYFSTKKHIKHKGVGLGLSVAFSIIRKHGGTIFAESIENKGSTFTILIPASERKIEEEKKKLDEQKEKLKLNILIMDDEDMICQIAQYALKTLGCTADSVNDGKDAVDKYKEAKEKGKPYDVVILDLIIPGGMGGKETIKRLKEYDPQVKGIVSTGYSRDLLEIELKEKGFVASLNKPYTIQQLRQTLRGLAQDN